MDSTVDCRQLIVGIRARLRQLNASLANPTAILGGDGGTGVTDTGSKQDANAHHKINRIDGATTHMLNDIQFHTDLRYEEQEQGLSMYALNNGKITLFWDAIDLKRKRTFLHEYVECEHKDLRAEWRQEIFDTLHEKLQSGHLDSRICWNGYYIESIDGFTVRVIADDDSADDAATPRLCAEFERKAVAKKKTSKPRKKEQGTIHNLRMHIARKKRAAQVGEFEE